MAEAERLTSVEICAGGGGQALGLEAAGFHHLALVEIDHYACETLRMNRPEWNVVEGDLTGFSATGFVGVTLLAGGVPCPPFSKAGKQLGHLDERDLFPQALRLVDECRPLAVMLENVRGLMEPRFDDYRTDIGLRLSRMGYRSDWKLFNASDFGVPQLRPRAVCVAMQEDYWPHFQWPAGDSKTAPTVGEALFPLMASGGWEGATEWRKRANRVAPTLVGGSHKHGGPDLGPTRAKRAWADLGVDALKLGDEVPGPNYKGMPRLTVEMAALVQGFPDGWKFAGRKTASYRQVGNAFPPPVAKAVGVAIASAVAARASLLPAECAV